MIKLKQLLLISLTSLFLSACGGGGGGSSGSSSSGSTVATSCATSTSSFCTTEFNNNYGLVTTKAYEAFDDGYDGDGVKVAVLDGQFDTSHADLDANIITGYDEEDDNGTVAHVGAYSDNHGTHVAGIIAAERNGTGMMGIAYNASIMPIKIFTDAGVFAGNISNSVAFAIDNGATVLNNSWGTSKFTSAATCTVGGSSYTCYGKIPGTLSSGFNETNEVTEWEDVATGNGVAVFAAGNEGNNSATGEIEFYLSDGTTYLTSYSPQVVKNAGLISYVDRSSVEARYGLSNSNVSENWLNVVAVDNTNTIASWSNGCGDTKAYCIAAPGKNIYSTINGGYGTKSGTSMAAPHVSGAVAVMKEKWPNLTGAQIIDLILSSATDLGASGTDDVYGVGLLNMAGAMTATTAQSFSYVDSNGNLNKISKEGSISANSILSNLASKNVSIGIVDGYDRVYSNKSRQFNSLKNQNITNEENFFKFRNGFSDADLNKFLSMSFVNYGNEVGNFDLKYRSYSFQEDEYQNTLLGDNFMTTGFLFDNLTLSTNIVDESHNNSLLLKNSFSSIKPNSQSSITFGYGYEKKRILNSDFSGAFEAKHNNTIYLNAVRKQKISEKDSLNFKLGYGITKSNFTNEELFNMSDLKTSSASIGYVHSEKTSKFALSLEAPLSISSGQANYNSVSGYDKYGNYKNGSQTIGLTPDNRELKFNLYYDKVINENTNYGIQFNQANSGSNNLQFIYSKTF